ncbi:hypothetical protein COU97_01005, partial [Candidatus Shapirobacteria bacterium CG10_big_fil_rev_8_21_14_0_10_48_15]
MFLTKVNFFLFCFGVGIFLMLFSFPAHFANAQECFVPFTPTPTPKACLSPNLCIDQASCHEGWNGVFLSGYDCALGYCCVVAEPTSVGVPAPVYSPSGCRNADGTRSPEGTKRCALADKVIQECQKLEFSF